MDQIQNLTAKAQRRKGPQSELLPLRRSGFIPTGRPGGFTLIELLVVLAIIATLLSIAVPRYFGHVESAKEASLRQTLAVTRDALDKYHADLGRYPETLDDLVTKRYLRKLPEDPVAGKTDSWQILAPPPNSDPGAVYDLKSGAPGTARDGSQFGDW